MKIIPLLLVIISIQNLQAFETKNQHFIELQQETKKENEYQDIQKIICSLFGLLFVSLFLPCLWYNERRQGIIENRLKIAFNICESVSCEEINPLNDGQLIHINGKTESNDVVFIELQYMILISDQL